MPDSFFADLCKSQFYSNSRLREDCLRVLMVKPELSEQADATLFLPSLLSHSIFKAIRTLSRKNKKASLQAIFESIEEERKSKDELMQDYVSGSQLITALFMLNVPEDDPEWTWKYSYDVLKWRAENDVCY